jgi:hypothetical protein
MRLIFEHHGYEQADQREKKRKQSLNNPQSPTKFQWAEGLPNPLLKLVSCST